MDASVPHDAAVSDASDAATDASKGVDAGIPIKLSGVVTDGSTPVAGVKVCLYQPVLTPQPCSTTASDGSYSLEVPANTQIVLSATDEPTYYPQLYMNVTTATDAVQDLGIVTSAKLGLLAASVSQTFDPKQASVAFGAQSTLSLDPDAGTSLTGEPGVSAAMSPASGFGPYYASTAGLPSVALTASTAYPLGAWVDVTPGTVDLNFTPPSGVTCTPLHSWPSGSANSISVLEVGGYLTYVSVLCQ